MFFTSLVPIRLEASDASKKIWWQTPRPSTRYYHPICLELIHESTNVIMETAECIHSQISILLPLMIMHNNEEKSSS